MCLYSSGVLLASKGHSPLAMDASSRLRLALEGFEDVESDKLSRALARTARWRCAVCMSKALILTREGLPMKLQLSYTCSVSPFICGRAKLRSDGVIWDEGRMPPLMMSELLMSSIVYEAHNVSSCSEL